MSNNVILLNCVSKSFGAKENCVLALNNISLSIDKGELIAITGPSGSGKSTLLSILGLLETKDSGLYELLGRDVGNLSEGTKSEIRNKHIGFIIQDFMLIERYTVSQNIAVPLSYTKEKIKKSAKKERIIASLKQLGIEEKYHSLVHSLSGGQRQRVAIARALINNPQIILADEPTGELDTENTQQIMDTFCAMRDMGKTILIATHDPAVAERCERKIVIRDGHLIP